MPLAGCLPDKNLEHSCRSLPRRGSVLRRPYARFETCCSMIPCSTPNRSRKHLGCRPKQHQHIRRPKVLRGSNRSGNALRGLDRYPPLSLKGMTLQREEQLSNNRSRFLGRLSRASEQISQRGDTRKHTAISLRLKKA